MKNVVTFVVGSILIIIAGVASVVLSESPSIQQMQKDQAMTRLAQAGHSEEMIDSLVQMQIIHGDRKFIWISDDKRLALLLCPDSCQVDTLFDDRRVKK